MAPAFLPPRASAWWMWWVSACVKLLLIPSYRSTDFEVHLHWVSLTSSFPLPLWYVDSSSPWTLDYPPLFAYFQLLLSPFSLLSPFKPLLYMRLSVISSDLSLLLSTLFIARRIAPDHRKRVLCALVLWSPALLIVDHVHFQYNGFLLGILLMSLALMAEGRDWAGGVFFAILVCFKHLFAVAGPVYFVYILRHHCTGRGLWAGVGRFVWMGAGVVTVLAAAFGPFVYHGQMRQVLERLFPFGRGLCHAYWAPNFWVFYIILDKVLALLLTKLGFDIRSPTASFTGGLVGDSPSFAVLPQVSPKMSLLFVLLAMSPCIVQAWRAPHPRKIIRWVAYAYTCGFLFGWHVHEKASLHFVIPLGIIAVENFEDAKHYFLLATVSCYSMFPLLFEPQEYPIKVLLLAIYSIIMWLCFSSLFNNDPAAKVVDLKRPIYKSGKNGVIGQIGLLYILGLIAVEIWGQFLHSLIFGRRLPFLPLMLVSVFCAMGMMYSWLWQLRKVLQSD